MNSGKNITRIDKSIFAERLSKAIKDSGITRKQLADILNRSIDSVDGWCSSKKENYPPTDITFEICKVLNVDFDYLIGLIDAPTHTIDEISKITGLSTNAIKVLEYINDSKDSNKFDEAAANNAVAIGFINMMLEKDYEYLFNNNNPFIKIDPPDIPNITYHKVPKLPETGEKGTIYLVGADAYIWQTIKRKSATFEKFEKIDLSNIDSYDDLLSDIELPKEKPILTIEQKLKKAGSIPVANFFAYLYRYIIFDDNVFIDEEGKDLETKREILEFKLSMETINEQRATEIKKEISDISNKLEKQKYMELDWGNVKNNQGDFSLLAPKKEIVETWLESIIIDYLKGLRKKHKNKLSININK